MKTIGLIGGMSWESTLVYYKIINEKIRELLGGFHSAKCIIVSTDFAEIEELQHKNNWQELDDKMVEAAQQTEKAGADFILLCTNTMHLCSNAIVKNTSVPFIHIAQATAEKILEKGFRKVALLGTKFTMEKEFYKSVLAENGIETLIPDEADRELVHRVIYSELVHGKIKNESQDNYRQIIKKLEKKGAEGVILGCTEIPLLISETDVDIPVLDTTKIHAEKAVKSALESNSNF